MKMSVGDVKLNGSAKSQQAMNGKDLNGNEVIKSGNGHVGE